MNGEKHEIVQKKTTAKSRFFPVKQECWLGVLFGTVLARLTIFEFFLLGSVNKRSN